ncbi:MAG TPA: STAS domain-containing protein [Mycobacterium sp.]|nr:STAS domain-containing protein [Mycobacterium sp.]HPZ94397.1 STAS domain-containing protein [Mycobacterium sp.]HQE13965.1 STAS domain-containing protein [Mycobacterium sp.]
MERSTASTRSIAIVPAAGCVIDEEWHGRAVVISVAGVLDMLTAPQLEASLTAALAKKPAAIIVDLTDVDFLASAGMGVLVAARDLADDGVRFAVVASGPATSRPLTLVGLADLLGLRASLAEARADFGV